jgi:pimeloyl-ACP methyl ester carboxylesterase
VPDAPRPGLLRLALETRAPVEFFASALAAPALLGAPQGDGHTVVVYPGFLAADSSTAPLRRLLKALGYEALGWEQGRNTGVSPATFAQAEQQIKTLAATSGKLSLVGWSLGGIYARELAKRAPDLIRNVVTLGSPFAQPPDNTNASRLFEWVNRNKERVQVEYASLKQAPPVPTTSIFSRTDGIVPWQASIQEAGPMSESIEVSASHLGLGVNPFALYALADRLSQAPGQWQAFEIRGMKRLWFRGVPK